MPENAFDKIVETIHLFGYHPDPKSPTYHEDVMEIYQRIQRDAWRQLHKDKMSSGMAKEEYEYD